MNHASNSNTVETPAPEWQEELRQLLSEDPNPSIFTALSIIRSHLAEPIDTPPPLSPVSPQASIPQSESPDLNAFDDELGWWVHSDG